MAETVYYSRLWKAGLLTAESPQFRALVRAAARFYNKPFSEEMLNRVGTDPAIVDALEVKTSETIDLALQRYATDPDTAGIMDGLILAAVEAFEVPEQTPPTDPTT